MKPIILVCGFGRCGSSCVMQMLEAGGFPVTGKWPAFEDGISLKESGALRWQAKASGKAVKFLDPLNHKLPLGVKFRAIWLDRDPTEQAASQMKFLAASFGVKNTRRMRLAMKASLKHDRTGALRMLAHHCQEILVMSFEDILRDQPGAARKIAALVDSPVNQTAMAMAVRHRSPKCLPGLMEIELLRERAA